MKMKYLKVTFVLAMIALVSTSQATSFFTIYIDGDSTGKGLVQGQTLNWCTDCGVGDVVISEIYFDVDSSRTITLPDIALGIGPSPDGDTLWAKRRRDSVPGPDGFIYTRGRRLWLKPGPMIMGAIDEDGSSAYSWFDIVPNPEPAIEIAGTVRMDGVSPPNKLFQKIMVGFCLLEPRFTVWSGIDDFGNFSLGLPFYYRGQEVEIRLRDLGVGFIKPKPIKAFIKESENPDIAISVSKPTAWVSGKIIDQNGNSVGPVHLIFSNKENSEISGRAFFDDKYCFGAVEGDYLILSQKAYKYMYPTSMDFHLTEGDTLINDIVCYKPDTFVYVRVIRPKPLENSSFYFTAHAAGYYIEAYSNVETGVVKIPVCSELSNEFAITLKNYPLQKDYDYRMEKRSVSIGDTLTIHLIPEV